MRILQVIEGLGVGGAEQLQVILAAYIDRGRYDLRVCSLVPLDESPIIRDLRALGVPLSSLGGMRLRDPRYLRRLVALLRTQRIDVVHTHLRNAHVLGVLAGALTRRPVVCTLHNISETSSGAGSLLHATQARALRWGARVVIACAPEVAVAAGAHLHLPPSKVVVVPNGIDIRAYEHLDRRAVETRRRELLGGRGGPLLVSIGNVRDQKGHQYLVQATPRLLDAFPGARVVIVGPESNNVETVRARIRALGLEGQVLLAGERRDIPEILAAADLFVLPSLWEGLPLALLEAMAAGTPVVATPVGGVVGVVQDGITARLVPPADADALADALLDLLRQPDQAHRLARAARAHVRAHYGGDAWAQRLQAIYSSTVAVR